MDQARLSALHAQLLPLCRARGWYIDIHGRYVQIRLRPEALAYLSITASGYVIAVTDFVHRGTSDWHDADIDLFQVKAVAEQAVVACLERRNTAAPRALEPLVALD
ncbi:MAG: hypothetical protein U1F43_07015 [Myxococcota bacterium]